MVTSADSVESCGCRCQARTDDFRLIKTALFQLSSTAQEFGAPSRTRTCNLALVRRKHWVLSQLLYRLSYGSQVISGGESRNRTHVAGISGPICFRGSAIT